MIRALFFAIEDAGWNIKCHYNFWLHGPYGLSKVIEKMPFRFIIKYLRKYGATIGDNCRFERGINLHRPDLIRPYKNLIIGKNVYLGHNVLIDLTAEVEIENNVIIASGVQIWTHASRYLVQKADNLEYTEDKGKVTIGEASIIYSGVIISHNKRIGKICRIGANSLIVKNVADFDFVGGVPAKLISS
jgi:serine acetyltransferase